MQQLCLRILQLIKEYDERMFGATPARPRADVACTCSCSHLFLFLVSEASAALAAAAASTCCRLSLLCLLAAPAAAMPIRCLLFFFPLCSTSLVKEPAASAS